MLRTWSDVEREIEDRIDAEPLPEAVCMLCGDRMDAGDWQKKPPRRLWPFRASLRRKDPVRYDRLCDNCIASRLCAHLPCATCPAGDSCPVPAQDRKRRILWSVVSPLTTRTPKKCA